MPYPQSISIALSSLATKMLSLFTTDGDYARLRVDPAQTSFFDGREFRMIRKIDSPVVFKFESTVNFILFKQILSISNGDVELYALRADNVTDNGGWATVPTFRKNLVNTAYTSGVTISNGGSIAVTDANLYVDYDRVETANSTAQRVSIDGQGGSERYLTAGTYYVQLVGTGSGLFGLEWEERP